MYKEKANWAGEVRLFFGAKTQGELLYMNKGREDISIFFTKQTFANWWVNRNLFVG